MTNKKTHVFCMPDAILCVQQCCQNTSAKLVRYYATRPRGTFWNSAIRQSVCLMAQLPRL